MVSRVWSLRACGSVNPIIEKQRVAALEREPESEGRVRECLVTRIERSTVMVGQEKAEALMMVSIPSRTSRVVMWRPVDSQVCDANRVVSKPPGLPIAYGR